jgi:hypothetical protein
MIFAVLLALLIVLMLLGNSIMSAIIHNDIQGKLNNTKDVEANISVGDVSYNVFLDKMLISNVKINISSEDSLSRDYYSIAVPRIKGTGFSLLDWLINKGIKFDKLLFDINSFKYISEYKQNPHSDPEVNKVRKNWRKKLEKIIPGRFKSLKINHIQFNAKNIIRDIYQTDDVAFTDSVEKVTLNIKDFRFDRSLNRYPQNGDLSIYISNYLRKFSADYMSLKIRKIKGLSKFSYISLQDVSYSPYVNQELIDERFPFRKNIYKVKNDKVEIQGFNFNKLIEENRFKANSAIIRNFDYDVFVNKRKEADPKDTNNRINLEFRSIPYWISIDQIHVSSGRIV